MTACWRICQRTPQRLRPAKHQPGSVTGIFYDVAVDMRSAPDDVYVIRPAGTSGGGLRTRALRQPAPPPRPPGLLCQRPGRCPPPWPRWRSCGRGGRGSATWPTSQALGCGALEPGHPQSTSWPPTLWGCSRSTGRAPTGRSRCRRGSPRSPTGPTSTTPSTTRACSSSGPRGSTTRACWTSPGSPRSGRCPGAARCASAPTAQCGRRSTGSRTNCPAPTSR